MENLVKVTTQLCLMSKDNKLKLVEHIAVKTKSGVVVEESPVMDLDNWKVIGKSASEIEPISMFALLDKIKTLESQINNLKFKQVEPWVKPYNPYKQDDNLPHIDKTITWSLPDIWIHHK